jgi:hypothetical protein
MGVNDERVEWEKEGGYGDKEDEGERKMDGRVGETERKEKWRVEEKKKRAKKKKRR